MAIDLSFEIASKLLFLAPMVAGGITIIVIENPAWSVAITVTDACTSTITFSCSFDQKQRICCTPEEMI
jgi:hypothetical protein